MKLTELEPRFVRYLDGGLIQTVQTIEECQGLWFLCPKCFAQNKGPIGTHAVLCWSATRGVPANVGPLPGRWTISGTNLEDVTLSGENGKSSSVLLTDGCRWHGFITNGEVR